MPRRALVAIGGNALLQSLGHASVTEERERARHTSRAIARLVADGWTVLVTHGNGPQVGAELVRSERGAAEVYPLSLNVCVATTQGEVGYLLQQALREELAARGLRVPVATVLTQVVVSPDDPAFGKPTKPIGPFYTAEEAEARRARYGWTLVEVPGRGFRRVVPSPQPLEVVEEDVISTLVGAGALVIALGGGGIPVVREGGRLVGVEAVIDKDLASALLASRLGVDLFVISTDVDRVYLDYGRPTERPLGLVTVDELERYRREAHFPPGSMGPKVDAALRFLREGGREVIITRAERLAHAVRGRGGTHIVATAAERAARRMAS
jgi:carbamate kinase